MRGGDLHPLFHDKRECPSTTEKKNMITLLPLDTTKHTVERVTFDSENASINGLTAESMETANSMLRRACWSAPSSDLGQGYHKTTCLITFSDGAKFAARLDLTLEAHDANLGDHVRRHWEFMAGLWKPLRYTEEQAAMIRDRVKPEHREQCKQFLKEYDLS